MIFINKQSKLKEICQDLSKEKILYMDTEFDRRNTYYAILSIVQISTHNQKIIIDAMSGMDLLPLKQLLDNHDILKVFHSPDQDFEIFLNIFSILPKNVFDTQTASGVCGLGGGLGYQKLCKLLLNIDIDKTFQKANWLTRPLSKELLNYAIRDTEFLIPLHRILSEMIDSRRLWDNYNARNAKLCDIKSYHFSADRILQKMELDNKTTVFYNNLLQLIIFREECAKILNIPRGRCAKDSNLINICSILPTRGEDLRKNNLDFLPITKGKFRQKLLDLCAGLKNK